MQKSISTFVRNFVLNLTFVTMAFSFQLETSSISQFDKPVAQFGYQATAVWRESFKVSSIHAIGVNSQKCIQFEIFKVFNA